jgi:hypothetical protein
VLLGQNDRLRGEAIFLTKAKNVQQRNEFASISTHWRPVSNEIRINGMIGPIFGFGRIAAEPPKPNPP